MTSAFGGWLMVPNKSHKKALGLGSVQWTTSHMKPGDASIDVLAFALKHLRK